MFTDGLMRLHDAGRVIKRKGQFDGVSVATFAGGSAELYHWLDGNVTKSTWSSPNTARLSFRA
jgi:hypothetical protein